MKHALVALALMLATLLLVTRSSAAPKPPLSYVERVLHAEPNDELPLLLVLHGLGDSPERFIELFETLDTPVRIIAARAPDPFRTGSSWFPIDDPKRAGKAILERAQLLVRLLGYLEQKRPTRGLPVVTGFSQGGILSFALAAYHSERIAASLPVAGQLLDSLPSYRRARPGFTVTAFHGREDGRIPYAGGERTVARLKAVGTSATLTGYEGVGHEVPEPMRQALAAALQVELRRSER